MEEIHHRFPEHQMEIGAELADLSLYFEFENRSFASLQICIFTHSPVKSIGILSPFCRWISRGREATQPVKDRSASNSYPSGLPPEPCCPGAEISMAAYSFKAFAKDVTGNLEHYYFLKDDLKIKISERNEFEITWGPISK